MNKQNLVLKELTIVTQREKRARNFQFKKNINIIKSEDKNKTGKSTLLKTIYHTLGGDIKFHPSWKAINPISLLTFQYNDENYSFLRHENFFGVFDSQDNLIDAFSGITKGLDDFISNFFNYKLKLILNKSGEINQATPAFLYLPYYIDQDKGWQDTLKSFESLSQFKQDKKSILEFHIGLKPSEYYSSTAKIQQYKIEYEKLYEKKEVVIQSQKDISDDFTNQIVNLDINMFKKEIEILLSKVNILNKKQTNFRSELLELKDKEYRLKNQLQSSENSLLELEKDYKFIEKNIGLNGVECPTCGTHFKNNFYQKYEMLKSAEECKLLIVEFTNDIAKVKTKITNKEEKFYSNEKDIQEIDEVLKVKKSELDLNNFIEAQVEQKISKTFNSKLDSYEKKLTKKLKSQKEEEENRKIYLDRERSKDILNYYRDKLKIYLNKLNIHSSYTDLAITFKETGSDLPRAILAYHYSILETINSYSSSTKFPIIIDSYKQQDQGAENLKIMLDFILEQKPKNSQLLLGTVTFQEELSSDENSVIVLTEERELLKKDFYNDLNPRITNLLNDVINKLNLE